MTWAALIQEYDELRGKTEPRTWGRDRATTLNRLELEHQKAPGTTEDQVLRHVEYLRKCPLLLAAPAGPLFEGEVSA